MTGICSVSTFSITVIVRVIVFGVSCCIGCGGVGTGICSLLRRFCFSSVGSSVTGLSTTLGVAAANAWAASIGCAAARGISTLGIGVVSGRTISLSCVRTASIASLSSSIWARISSSIRSANVGSLISPNRTKLISSIKPICNVSACPLCM